MTLPKWFGYILLIIFTPLYAIAFTQWIIFTVVYKEQWACINCRKDEQPSVKQQFLYYTIWNMWFSIAIFGGLAAKKYSNRFLHNSLLEKICWVGLPSIITTFSTYIYYIATNPSEGYFNTEECYTLGRAMLSKQLVSSQRVIDTILVFGVISDLVLHYFSAPLMVFFLLLGELNYDVGLWRPYSTLFIFILGMVAALGQTFGSRVYCGNAWFNSGGTVVLNFLVHCILTGSVRLQNKMKHSGEIRTTNAETIGQA